jgi:4-amino-4-deoxy-L-arabinose transferase-like glycosyltransferase
MSAPRSSRLPGAALLLAVGTLYLSGARGRMVLDVDEALYIAAGNGMARTGDLVTPYVNGVRFLDKPPLLYWLLAGLDRLLGPGELAAHLPPVLAVLATAGLLLWIGARGAGPAGGRAAGAVFAFSVGTWLFTRETLPDGPLIAFVTLAMAVAVAFRLGRLGAATASAAFGAALAGAVLSKSLLGLVLPLATLGIVRLLDPEPRRVRLRHAALAAATGLALAAPWHVAAALRNPGFFAHAIVNEQILRFFGQREPADVVSISLPVFWALFLVWLLPWTTFLPAAGLAAREGLRRSDARGVVARLAVAWAVVVLGFFSVSARLEHYAFAALPPLALLVGLALSSDAGSDRVARAVRGGFGAGAVFGAVLLLGGTVLALLGVAWGPAALGVGTARPDRAYDTDFGPLAGLPAELRRQLLPIAAVTLAALGLALLLARWLDRSGRRAAAVAALCGGAFVFGLMADHSLRACGDEISSRRFGLALARAAGPGDRFFVLGDFETANSIACYAPPRIELVCGHAPTLAWGLSFPDAPRLSVSPRELAAIWKGPERVFLLADKARLPSLGLPDAKVLAESADRALVSNRRAGASGISDEPAGG